MSAKVDQERREDSRHTAVMRGRGIVARLERLLSLYAEGKSDRDIALLFGWESGTQSGWSPRTVRRYRCALLKLRIDAKGMGADA